MPAEEKQAGPETFTCKRCQQAHPMLDAPPFATALGRKIQASICQPCWQEWFDLSIRVVNEYRLNLLSPEDGKVYDRCMCEFLKITE